MGNSKGKEDIGYSDQLEELTRIVDEIGSEECPIDLLEEKVRRAAELLRDLRSRLESTEMAVKEVLSELEGSDTAE